MPEGPTILMLREEADRFRGKIVRRASGNAKLDLTRLEGKRVKAAEHGENTSYWSFPAFRFACICCYLAVTALTTRKIRHHD